MSKFKISKGDVRVGNFIYHVENSHIKVTDVYGNVTHRVSKYIAKGQMLSVALENADKDPKMLAWLENYAIAAFNFLSAVPDEELLRTVVEATNDCFLRHKDLYGIKDDISKDEDDKILQETKDEVEAMEELKKTAEEGEKEGDNGAE